MVAFLAANPVLFPEPERTDNWLSESVLGERAWIAEDNPTFGRRYPEVLNTLNVPLYGYTLYAAYRRYTEANPPRLSTHVRPEGPVRRRDGPVLPRTGPSVGF